MSFAWLETHAALASTARSCARRSPPTELADRAGTLYRLGFSQAAATARLTARIAWEFDPPSKHGAHHRPDALSDAAIAKLVADTYARRPGW